MLAIGFVGITSILLSQDDYISSVSVNSLCCLTVFYVCSRHDVLPVFWRNIVGICYACPSSFNLMSSFLVVDIRSGTSKARCLIPVRFTKAISDSNSLIHQGPSFPTASVMFGNPCRASWSVWTLKRDQSMYHVSCRTANLMERHYFWSFLMTDHPCLGIGIVSNPLYGWVWLFLKQGASDLTIACFCVQLILSGWSRWGYHRWWQLIVLEL